MSPVYPMRNASFDASAPIFYAHAYTHVYIYINMIYIYL